MRKIQRFLLMLATFASFSISAQEKSVETLLDTNVFVIGNQVKLTYSYTAQPNDSVVWPLFVDTINSHLEIVKAGKIDTSLTEAGLRNFSQTLTITSFDSGYWVIQPQQFLVNGQVAESQPEVVAVVGVIIDTTSQRYFDIKEPLDIPFSFTEWIKENWQIIAGAVAAILLILLLIYWLKTRKPKETVVVEEKIVIPAHMLALEKLQTLETAKLWQQGEYKEYHTQLSEIIREYLEKRFNVMALEQTTDEIMRALRIVDISKSHKEQLKQLLVLSDLVKFAKEVPLASENEMVISNARAFIDATKLVETIKEEGENG